MAESIERIMGPEHRALYSVALMSFASRLKKARKAKGLSQQKLADIVGIEQPSVAAMESGKAAGTKHISAIARALAHAKPPFRKVWAPPPVSSP